MSKIYKTVLIFAVIIFISGSIIVSAAAQSRLVDNAGLLTDEEYNLLLSDLDSLSNEYSCEVVIVTENEQIFDIQDRADLLLESYGLNGILLYINMYGRDWAFSTYGESIPVFSDRRLDVMENNLLDRLSQDDYAGAFEAFISDSRNYLSLGPDINDDYNYDYGDNDYYSYSDDKMSIPVKILIALGVGLVIALIIDLVWVAKLKPVKLAYNANNYARDMNITSGGERFIRSSVSKTRREQSSSGGGGSSTHRSSSGGTHGGRSGKF